MSALFCTLYIVNVYQLAPKIFLRHHETIILIDKVLQKYYFQYWNCVRFQNGRKFLLIQHGESINVTTRLLIDLSETKISGLTPECEYSRTMTVRKACTIGARLHHDVTPHVCTENLIRRIKEISGSKFGPLPNSPNLNLINFRWFSESLKHLLWLYKLWTISSKIYL